MAEVKKYEFDNFVITNDKVIEASQPIEDVEIEDLGEEVVEDFHPAESVKTYTEEELQEAVKNAETQGYSRGLGLAKEGLNADISSVLIDINDKLTKIFLNEKIISETLELQFLEIGKSMVKKLLPQLADENAAEIVNKFIADNFNNLKKEGKLSFYIHPDIISLVQENIAKLANKNDFEGRISLHKDANLLRSDCRIEWENGGVEFNTNTIFEKVENLLDDSTTGESNNE